MIDRPSSNNQTQYLRAKRKEILRSRGRSSEHPPTQLTKYSSQEPDPSQFKKIERYLYGQLADKQKEIDELAEKNKMLNQENESLQIYIYDLQNFIQGQLTLKSDKTNKTDFIQNPNNMVFSFKLDNRDPAQKRHSSSYDKYDSQSTQIYPNASYSPFTAASSLKASANYLANQGKGLIYTQDHSGGLLKIPEQPEKELKKAKSEKHIDYENKSAKKSPDLSQKKFSESPSKTITHLKKKIQKLQKQNSQLQKECKNLKDTHKHKKGFHEDDMQQKEDALCSQNETMKKKIRKYENLIEKQQKQMEKIIQLCQEDIDEKNKEIAQITASYLEKKNGFQRKIDKLIQQKEQSSFNLHQAEQKIKYLEQKNRNLSSALEKLKKEFVRKEGASTTLEQKMKQLLMNNIALVREQDTFKTTIAQLQKHQKRPKAIPKMNDFIQDSFSGEGSQNIIVVNGKKFQGNGQVMFNTQF